MKMIVILTKLLKEKNWCCFFLCSALLSCLLIHLSSGLSNDVFVHFALYFLSNVNSQRLIEWDTIIPDIYISFFLPAIIINLQFNRVWLWLWVCAPLPKIKNISYCLGFIRKTFILPPVSIFFRFFVVFLFVLLLLLCVFFLLNVVMGTNGDMAAYFSKQITYLKTEMKKKQRNN